MLYLNDFLFEKDDGEDLTTMGVDVIDTLIIFEDPFSAEAIECAAKKINVNAEDLNEFLKDKKNTEFRDRISECHESEINYCAKRLLL